MRPIVGGFIHLIQLILKMLDYSNIYLNCDQPTTCSKCGARTKFIIDLSHTKSEIHIHKCLNKYCSFEFVTQSTEDG